MRITCTSSLSSLAFVNEKLISVINLSSGRAKVPWSSLYFVAREGETA